MSAQALNALGRANEIRIARADLKKAIAADPHLIFGVLDDPPECVLTAGVEEILKALPRFGPSRVKFLLLGAQISSFMSVGGLTARQRALLANCLREVIA
jgi:hypothetical protein